MAQYIRKDSEQVNIPEPLPPEKPGDKEDCGCTDSPATPTGSGSCPTEEYETGGFSLIVRNKTTGKCQWVDLDFIRDAQDDWIEPPNISYSPNPASFFVFDSVGSITPVNTGGVITSYEISGVLPDGLTFDTDTGIITGTASGTASDDTYTITAHGPGGDSSTDLEIIIRLQTFSIKYLGADGGLEDTDGSFSVGETRVYDFITKLPSVVFVSTRTFWYWFVPIVPGETFYMPAELPNQVLNPVGTIPTNGLWYYDRAQNDIGGVTQSQLGFNRLNGGVNQFAIQCAVVFVGPIGSHLSAITQFQIRRASDDAIMYDGLTDLTSNNPFIGNPFIPSSPTEFYYIKAAASSSFNIRVRAAFLNGQGSPLARDVTRSIASGNWNAEDDINNRFGAPLYITFS
jgi:hypothetical protein